MISHASKAHLTTRIRRPRSSQWRSGEEGSSATSRPATRKRGTASRLAHGYRSGIPAVLPLAAAASRFSKRRRSSVPRSRNDTPSMPRLGRNTASRSPAVILLSEWFMSRSGRTCLLEEVDEVLVSERDPCNGVFTCDFPGPIIHKRVPKIRPPYGEANETSDASRGRQPFMHLLVVLAAAENYEPDFVATTAVRGCDDFLAVLRALQAFDLPHVWLDPGILELVERLNH